MRELFRSNNAVRLSWAQAQLSDAGIESFILDHHTSLVEGSIGAIPRRLMVAERDHQPGPRRDCRGGGGAALSQPGPVGDAFTEDALLGGRIRLRQPANGARVAIDPIFLAAAVPAKTHQLVLDIGCGSGAATLCLAARVPQCRVFGLELQRDLARLAADNAALNGMAECSRGRRRRPAARRRRASAPARSTTSWPTRPISRADAARRRPTRPRRRRRSRARPTSPTGCASRWRWSRPKGSITFVHRADRIDALLALLAGRAGEVAVFPLWPAAGRAASRILVRARKQVAAPARLLPGLVLHDADGRFTPAAEAVLRGGEALTL